MYRLEELRQVSGDCSQEVTDMICQLIDLLDNDPQNPVIEKIRDILNNPETPETVLLEPKTHIQ